MLPLILIFFFGVDKGLADRLGEDIGDPPAQPVALPETALPQTLMEFMGGQGCTFTPARDVPTRLAGFDPFEVEQLIAQSLEAGTATMAGDYVVLDPSICTIRLPQIVSEYSVDHPAIIAMAPYIREEDSDGVDTIGEEGCFIESATALFAELEGGDAQAGFDTFLAFVAAGIMSGDVRFYAPSPLVTPRGFQITSGDCGKAPNIDVVQASYPLIAQDFGTYVRRLGAATPCGERPSLASNYIAAELQGVEPGAQPAPDAPFNAWLGFEFDLITMAAGWHEGMSGDARGTPRPPLCHVANP